MAGSDPQNDFMTETEIQSFFWDEKPTSLKSWIDGHYPESGRNPNIYGRYDKVGKNDNYETIVDEWFKWFITGQNGNLDVIHLFDNTTYFLAPAIPFQSPYHTRIIMEKEASLLVRIYCMSVSSQEYPSLSNKADLINLLRKDLLGINWNTFEARLDGEKIYGRCVIRKNPIKINVDPSQHLIGFPQKRLKQKNSLEIYHAGFWLLIRPDRITAGDHLLYLKAFSRNYETEAKILINATC